MSRVSSACIILLPLIYQVVGAPPAEICGSAEVYNTDRLLSAPAWHFHFDCFSEIIGQTCDFYFSLCQPLTTLDGCVGASACKVSKNGQSQVIGTYNTHNPFSTNTGGLVATLDDGQAYNTSTGLKNLSMVIRFNCNLNAPWYVGGGNSSDVPKSAAGYDFNFNEDAGVYNLVVSYDGACIPVFPEPDYGISAGSILLIGFICTVSTYFLLGSAINYATGKRGNEVMPNSIFWSQLPTNVTAGFKFTCACITCSRTVQEGTTAFAKKTGYDTI